MSGSLSLLRAALEKGAAPAAPSALPSTPTFEYAVSRLLKSWGQNSKFGADETVLLRQVVRWAGPQSFHLGPPNPPSADLDRCLARAGVRWSSDGYVHAQPFSPPWLPDARDCDRSPRECRPDESFPAESYLHSISYQKWRSQAQKEAAWCVLNTPPGHTRIIVLPTGAGKSLCFQLLPRFKGGLTLVIVPTVALAIDQQATAKRLLSALPGVNPCFFSAGDDSDAKVQQVRDHRTRLVFASPEACVSGRLRRILDEFAATGWLENLVVDEAHMIETWGAQFRVEFQVLSAVRRQWLNFSRGNLRTFLFSATMTNECRELLHGMFSDGSDGSQFVCQRLRPEIQFYGQRISDSPSRDQAIVNAFWHLPRPAILYVTEKSEAEKFFSLFRGEGFIRLARFHGDTPGSERIELLRKWKDDEIDLMIGTSAFGLGVDKPDVRAVVHACYPENLDRYYQEVGRGGRDGWSSISILLPTSRDREIAEGITVKLMTPDMIQARWKAMFSKAEDLGDYIYELPLGAKRAGLEGMHTYAENQQWNKRLLLQMYRAKKIDLRNVMLRDSAIQGAEREEWAEVKVNFSPHAPNLSELMSPQRDEELRYFYRGLDQVEDFLAGKKCAARVLSRLYGVESDQRACAGCSHCRALEHAPLACPNLSFPKAEPREHPTAELIERCPSPFDRAGRSGFIDLIYRCVTTKHLSQFFCPENQFSRLLDSFSEAFGAEMPEMYRIDPLDNETAVSAFLAEPLGFFHFGQVNSTAIAISRKHNTVHFFCDVKNPSDQNGRHVSTNVIGSRLWASPSAWLVSNSN